MSIVISLVPCNLMCRSGAVRVGDVEDDRRAVVVATVGEPEPELADRVVGAHLHSQHRRRGAREVAEEAVGAVEAEVVGPGFGSATVSLSPAPIV